MRQVTGMIHAVVFFLGAIAFATIFGFRRGVVHDPQHRPVQGAMVMLKARNSDWMHFRELPTDEENSEFTFCAHRELHGHSLIAGFPANAAERDC